MSPALDLNLEACWSQSYFVVKGLGVGFHGFQYRGRGSWCLLAYQTVKANSQIQALPNYLQALNWSHGSGGSVGSSWHGAKPLSAVRAMFPGKDTGCRKAEVFGPLPIVLPLLPSF